MQGFLNICKPPGVSSHDMVSWVRRTLQMRKVGHTGTLDPGAAGVLVIGCHKATKLTSYVQAFSKEYRAELRLGISTSSQDAFGEIIARKDVPLMTPRQWQDVLDQFVGESEQIPPMTSAIKVKGQKLYELARQGKEVEREGRKIEIYNCRYVDYDATRRSLTFDAECSKGTYIRTLCADIAARAGTVGYMAFLLRTRVGPFCLKTSQTMAEVTTMPLFHNMVLAVDHLPKILARGELLDHVKSGRNFEIDDIIPGQTVAVLTADQQLLALAQRVATFTWQPFKVFWP